MPKPVKVLGIAVLLLLAAQLIQPNRDNPLVDPTQTIEAQTYITPEVAHILARSCSDCHSNTTVWLWYSHVAPISWVIGDDVRDGRSHLNFSRWGKYDLQRRTQLLKQICKEVKNGDMPLWSYTLCHKGTKLSADERRAVCSWSAGELQNTSQQLQAVPASRN